MAAAELRAIRTHNPVDLVEQVSNEHNWTFERSADDELTMNIAGSWTDYHISINWRDDIEALHMACAFDLKVSEARLPEVYKLIAQINEQLWMGHFDLWTQDGIIMFRHALMLNGTIATPGQCEALLCAALDACERYYQAFQYVVWAGKDSREALTGTMFETDGRA